MNELETFRSEIRSLLEGAPARLRGLPSAMAGRDDEESSEVRADRRRWLQLMAERGLTAPPWPREYGGGGLSPQQVKVLQEEMVRLELPSPLLGMGLSLIGPTLLVHASEAQKREFLPKIASGEYRFCQGFSEPGAGSDLASLRTAAQPDPSGEYFVINGQKIWTSGAQFANWIFMLVRTDESSKHNGITFILVDMKTPGIEVRPIKLISGASPFCEVFFTDVRALAKNVIGGVNQGWTVAKTLLNFERSGTSAGAPSGQPRDALAAVANLSALAKQAVGERDGRIADPALRDEVASVMLDEMALALTRKRAAEGRRAGAAPGPEISMFKLFGSELGQRRDELTLRLRGSDALGWDGERVSEQDRALTRSWLRAKATTIYAGSSEIQRNIISKRVLRLPSAS
jgi:alkylation response protein AidB-like acyl-CoA dehydrogenase